MRKFMLGLCLGIGLLACQSSINNRNDDNGHVKITEFVDRYVDHYHGHTILIYTVYSNNDIAIHTQELKR